MFLFFEGFQPQNAMFLLSMKHSDILIAKIAPNFNNAL